MYSAIKLKKKSPRVRILFLNIAANIAKIINMNTATNKIPPKRNKTEL